MPLSALVLLLAISSAPTGRESYFEIAVLDEQTGRGVPLVELRTVDNTRYWTDSNGLVAFHEPGLMNQKVFFHVESHGYEFPKDVFGFRGKALVTTPGTRAELRMRRVNVAERLYRATGVGIYRDSMLLAREVPIRQPLLNAQVAGSDSVNSVVFQGKIHWFWGDTNRPAYPLGTFHVPGAISRLPSDGGLDPSRGVDLEYFSREDGFVASTAEMPGDGPTWIDGVCVVRDEAGSERMFAKYVKVRKFLEVYERGLVEFKPETQRFEKRATFDFAAPLYPLGHALSVREGDAAYLYFGNPYPLVRVRARAEDLADPTRYEAFTPLKFGSKLDKPNIERDAAGKIVYGWKANTPPPAPQDEARWIAKKLIASNETLCGLRDVETGKPVRGHAGSVAWNAHRKRYVMIAEQFEGTSYLGEVWYAEADSPVGPWVYARKIVTHDKYSFYNPRHHPMFDQENGRKIFFEGTYATFLSGNDHPTPRYDYNQIMYGLDLDDPRLVLPVPIHQSEVAGQQSLQFRNASTEPGTAIAFMAPVRMRPGLIAIGWHDLPGDRYLKNVALPDALFFALPPNSSDAPPSTVKLFEWRQPKTGRRWYAIDGIAGPPGFTRSDNPLCRVWRYPLSLTSHQP